MASPDTTIWFRNNWHLLPRAQRVDIGGTVVGVASLDDIIASKEALGAPWISRRSQPCTKPEDSVTSVGPTLADHQHGHAKAAGTRS